MKVVTSLREVESITAHSSSTLAPPPAVLASAPASIAPAQVASTPDVSSPAAAAPAPTQKTSAAPGNNISAAPHMAGPEEEGWHDGWEEVWEDNESGELVSHQSNR